MVWLPAGAGGRSRVKGEWRRAPGFHMWIEKRLFYRGSIFNRLRRNNLIVPWNQIGILFVAVGPTRVKFCPNVRDWSPRGRRPGGIGAEHATARQQQPVLIMNQFERYIGHK